MATLHYLIGLPGSGKSTYGKEFSEKEPNLKVLSSDSIRAEMFGSEEVQQDAGKVFEVLFKRAKELLAQGYNVMVDATNINRKKRMNALKQFPNVYKVAHYIATPLSRCIVNDLHRERIVGHEVINRMYEQMQVPVEFEGWDDIIIVNTSYNKKYDNEFVENLNEIVEQNLAPHHNIMELLSTYFGDFKNILNLPQDSKYHSLSVSRHTYYVYEYLQKNYHGDDRLAMLWAGLLHDTGKYRTKRFKPEARYANFLQHENVSAQIACHILNELGYEKEFILKVMEICQLHMDLMNVQDNTAKSRKHELWGEELYDKLTLFHMADTEAK